MELPMIIFFPKLETFIVFLCALSCICGRRFAEPGYYPDGYYDSQQYVSVNAGFTAALAKLDHEPQLVKDWPDSSVKLGQVSGLALDKEGRLLVFHRASNVWDANTFTNREVYTGIGEPPIPHATVLVFNDTGELVDMWGQNLFHIPHGITMDKDGNVFVTDVALHQVFKFDAGNWKKPSMVLGEKFVPGNDEQHFCKPSAVAVLPSGEFFIADGYCNHRILKMAADGTIILQWGRSHGDSPFVMNVPHALTLASDRGLVCVADRERGRVACFRTDNGTFVGSYSSWLIGPRLFSVAYHPSNGGRLYVVNGPAGTVPVRGYVINFSTGKLVGSFAPPAGLANPHDVVVSPDGTKVYVAELNPYRVYKFISSSVPNATVPTTTTKDGSSRVKPTATVGRGVIIPAGAECMGGMGGGGGGGRGRRRATGAGRRRAEAGQPPR